MMKLAFLLTAGLLTSASSLSAQATLPAGTVGAAGGLNFDSPLVAESFHGLTPRHVLAASLLPGRVAVETDPARIRSGQASIRLQVQPGDCGRAINGGDPDDCASGNERVELNTGNTGGLTVYGFSLMLDGDFRNINREEPTAYLVQWFQQDAGACFDVHYSGSVDQIFIRNRCVGGSFASGTVEDTNLRIPPFDSWHEYVVLANWSKGTDGLFRVLVDNRLVYSFQGPTLAAEGGDQVSERFMVNRQNGLGRTSGTTTMWLDDVVTSTSLDAIEQVYAVDRTSLGVQ